jgi:hypothetical protein
MYAACNNVPFNHATCHDGGKCLPPMTWQDYFLSRLPYSIISKKQINVQNTKKYPEWSKIELCRGRSQHGSANFSGTVLPPVSSVTWFAVNLLVRHHHEEGRGEGLFAALQKRFDLCIPRNETVRPCSQFPHSCICERFIYFHDRSTYFAATKYEYRSWEYRNHSQICTWMWKLGSRPRSFIARKDLFEFSAQCLCNVSVYKSLW